MLHLYGNRLIEIQLIRTICKTHTGAGFDVMQHISERGLNHVDGNLAVQQLRVGGGEYEDEWEQ